MHRTIALIFSVILLAGCLTTSPSGRVVVDDGDTRVAVSFNSNDRRVIENYYGKHRKRVPPGLAKKGKLPPGLAKRQTLPPGLSGRGLPSDLSSRLSPLPRGYIHLRVGTDIIIMNKKTRVVFDVISGIN